METRRGLKSDMWTSISSYVIVILIHELNNRNAIASENYTMSDMLISDQQHLTTNPGVSSSSPRAVVPQTSAHADTLRHSNVSLASHSVSANLLSSASYETILSSVNTKFDKADNLGYTAVETTTVSSLSSGAFAVVTQSFSRTMPPSSKTVSFTEAATSVRVFDVSSQGNVDPTTTAPSRTDGDSSPALTFVASLAAAAMFSVNTSGQLDASNLVSSGSVTPHVRINKSEGLHQTSAMGREIISLSSSYPVSSSVAEARTNRSPPQLSSAMQPASTHSSAMSTVSSVKTSLTSLKTDFTRHASISRITTDVANQQSAAESSLAFRNVLNATETGSLSSSSVTYAGLTKTVVASTLEANSATLLAGMQLNSLDAKLSVRVFSTAATESISSTAVEAMASSRSDMMQTKPTLYETHNHRFSSPLSSPPMTTAERQYGGSSTSLSPAMSASVPSPVSTDAAFRLRHTSIDQSRHIVSQGKTGPFSSPSFETLPWLYRDDGEISIHRNTPDIVTTKPGTLLDGKLQTFDDATENWHFTSIGSRTVLNSSFLEQASTHPNGVTSIDGVSDSVSSAAASTPFQVSSEKHPHANSFDFTVWLMNDSGWSPSINITTTSQPTTFNRSFASQQLSADAKTSVNYTSSEQPWTEMGQVSSGAKQLTNALSTLPVDVNSTTVSQTVSAELTTLPLRNSSSHRAEQTELSAVQLSTSATRNTFVSLNRSDAWQSVDSSAVVNQPSSKSLSGLHPSHGSTISHLTQFFTTTAAELFFRTGNTDQPLLVTSSRLHADESSGVLTWPPSNAQGTINSSTVSSYYNVSNVPPLSHAVVSSERQETSSKYIYASTTPGSTDTRSTSIIAQRSTLSNTSSSFELSTSDGSAFMTGKRQNTSIAPAEFLGLEQLSLTESVAANLASQMFPDVSQSSPAHFSVMTTASPSPESELSAVSFVLLSSAELKTNLWPVLKTSTEVQRSSPSELTSIPEPSSSFPATTEESRDTKVSSLAELGASTTILNVFQSSPAHYSVTSITNLTPSSKPPTGSTVSLSSAELKTNLWPVLKTSTEVQRSSPSELTSIPEPSSSFPATTEESRDTKVSSLAELGASTTILNVFQSSPAHYSVTSITNLTPSSKPPTGSTVSLSSAELKTNLWPVLKTSTEVQRSSPSELTSIPEPSSSFPATTEESRDTKVSSLAELGASTTILNVFQSSPAHYSVTSITNLTPSSKPPTGSTVSLSSAELKTNVWPDLNSSTEIPRSSTSKLPIFPVSSTPINAEVLELTSHSSKSSELFSEVTIPPVTEAQSSVSSAVSLTPVNGVDGGKTSILYTSSTFNASSFTVEFTETAINSTIFTDISSDNTGQAPGLLSAHSSTSATSILPVHPIPSWLIAVVIACSLLALIVASLGALAVCYGFSSFKWLVASCRVRYRRHGSRSVGIPFQRQWRWTPVVSPAWSRQRLLRSMKHDISPPRWNPYVRSVPENWVVKSAGQPGRSVEMPSHVVPDHYGVMQRWHNRFQEQNRWALRHQTDQPNQRSQWWSLQNPAVRYHSGYFSDAHGNNIAPAPVPNGEFGGRRNEMLPRDAVMSFEDEFHERP